MKKFNLLFFGIVVALLSSATYLSAQYTAIDNTTLSQTWAFMQSTDNLPRWFTRTAFQKGLAYYDGKLFVSDAKSEGKLSRIHILSPETGDSITSLLLPADSKGVNANSHLQVIDVDRMGNLYACNLQTTAQIEGKEFLVYRWTYNPETKTYNEGTIFMEYSFAGNADLTGNIRVGDYFCVYGNLDGDEGGYILAPLANNAATNKKVVKWNFQNGVMQSVQIIDMKYHATLASNGNVPYVRAYDDTKFFLDTQLGFVELYDFNGNAVAYFSGSNRSGVPGEADSPTHTGGKGTVAFKVFGREFILLAGNNSGTNKNIPAYTMQLFEITSPEKGWSSAKLLYNLPSTGFGSTVTDRNMIVPAIDLSEASNGKVRLFGLTPSNGIAAFELNVTDTSTSVDVVKENFNIRIREKVIRNGIIELMGDEVSSMALYTLDGQKLRSVSNQMQMNVGELKGLFILRIQSISGNEQSEKVLIQ